jgi:hypothetical protein
VLDLFSTLCCEVVEAGSESSIVLLFGRRSASKKEWPPRRDVDVPWRRDVAPEPTTNVLLSKSWGSPMWSQCT